MEVLKIRTLPDKILRQECKKVDKITPEIRHLFDVMVETMVQNEGIGLAAPQVGIDKQLIVVQIEPLIYRIANPVIVKTKSIDAFEEGCLSVPGEKVGIERPYEVIVYGINEKNEKVEIKAKALLARVFQHEIDHLYGKLIVDYKDK